MQKHKFSITFPITTFGESVPVAPEHEKWSIDVLHARRYANALGDPQVPPDAKHKFSVMCLGALFLASVPIPPKHEK
jgi:hypothetical protein